MKVTLTKIGASIITSLIFLDLTASLAGDVVFVTASGIMTLIVILEIIDFKLQIDRLRSIEVILKVLPSVIMVKNEAQIEATITNKSNRRIGMIRPILRFDDSISLLDEQGTYNIFVEGGSSVTLRWTAVPLEMGDKEIGFDTIRLNHNLGLFTYDRSIARKTVLSVIPRIPQRQDLYGIRTSQVVAPSIRMISRKKTGIEFTNLREYYRGDDHKRIAWKAMAKSPTQTPKTKEFQGESDISVLVVVSNGPYVGDGPPGQRKLDYMAEVALAIVEYARLLEFRIAVLFNEENNSVCARGTTLDIAARIRNVSPSGYNPLAGQAMTALAETNEPRVIVVLLDLPRPEKIPLEPIKRLINAGNYVTALLLDTSSFWTYSGAEQSLKLASSLLTEDEQSHSMEQIQLIKELGIPGYLGGPREAMRHIVEVMQTLEMLSVR